MCVYVRMRAMNRDVVKYVVLWIFKYSEFIPAISRFSSIGRGHVDLEIARHEHRCSKEELLYHSPAIRNHGPLEARDILKLCQKHPLNRVR